MKLPLRSRKMRLSAAGRGLHLPHIPQIPPLTFWKHPYLGYEWNPIKVYFLPIWNRFSQTLFDGYKNIFWFLMAKKKKFFVWKLSFIHWAYHSYKKNVKTRNPQQRPVRVAIRLTTMWMLTNLVPIGSSRMNWPNKCFCQIYFGTFKIDAGYLHHIFVFLVQVDALEIGLQKHVFEAWHDLV